MRYIIKAVIYSILIIFILLVFAVILCRITFFLNTYDNIKSNNILVLSNNNGYMYKDIYHNGVCLWAYYILYEYLSKKYKNINFKLYFKSVKNNTRIRKFIKYIKKYKIKYIIPTESKNLTYLSKYKTKLLKYVNMIVPDNYKIIKELDDKYSCYLFCKKYNIPTPETICVNNISKKKLEYFIDKYNFPLYLKKSYDTNGSIDVFKIDNKIILEEKLQDIKGKWILQNKLEHNHASIDILYLNGIPISITIHSHKWHTNMRSISTEYFFPTIYSLETHVSVDSKYIKDIIKIVKKVGKYSNYSGIMNIDILINNDKPYLLEINPRFSGSIYISIKTSLLNDYFNILFKKKINMNKIPHIDYKKNKIHKASEVKDYSIVPFCVENIDVILSIDKININTYVTI